MYLWCPQAVLRSKLIILEWLNVRKTLLMKKFIIVTRRFLPPLQGGCQLKRTTGQLARTRAAENVRNNLSLLSRVAVPYTRPLLAKDARKMREKECEESIKAMEIRIEMRCKKRNNKR